MIPLELSTRQTSRWSGRGWTLEIWPDLIVSTGGQTQLIELDAVDKVRVRRGIFAWKLVGDGKRLLRLSGIQRDEIPALRGALKVLHVRRQLVDLVDWHLSVTSALDRAHQDQRWFPTELLQRLIDRTPPFGLRKLFDSLRINELLTPLESQALASLDRNLRKEVQDLNEQILDSELINQRGFLDSIEISPLTREQAEAVISFDSRVRLLAAAGSGKTSVMVARAAYAVKKGICDPKRILLLAFNKAAANELQQRIIARFEAAGIPSAGIRASTFHSLGLSVIGKASGSKPRLASWLDTGDELGTLIEIVDSLRDSDPTFRYKWDLYRLLFSQVSTDIEFAEFDGYDKEKRRRGFQTLRNETVRSHGERLIADFMFLNGVNYEYEKPYEHDVSDENHPQYRPDFYYPDADVWHEHWALDVDGNPPPKPDFKNYLKSKDWKIKTHRLHETKLVESTWADVVFADGLSKLQSDLEAHGLHFDWNPDREIPNNWAKPLDHPELAKLVRTFMAHAKSNSLSRDDISRKLQSATPKDSFFGSRSQLFLAVFWPIYDAWNQRLQEERSVDFEDMLVRAADLLMDESVDLDYDLVLVDEFQDSSQARARMVQGLLSKPDRFLLAVGDDWQSINRFAGSDISVMHKFEEFFGTTLTLALTKTFRCPRGIAHVATTFICRNPAQLQKKMEAIRPSQDNAIEILRQPEDSLDPVLDKILLDSGDRPASVLILGRYNFLRREVRHQTFRSLDITFKTVHGSKGLEADYVIVLGLKNGNHGFPSLITDDPVLQLAMPEPELFPHAEERRLFYVALTRAKRKVYLLASAISPSPFVVEVLRDRQVEDCLVGDDSPGPCPSCEIGLMKKRPGPRGEFLGCSRFPACNYTARL